MILALTYSQGSVVRHSVLNTDGFREPNIGSGLSHCHEERGERKPNHRMALLKDKAIG
jgi:hypothetical protein